MKARYSEMIAGTESGTVHFSMAFKQKLVVNRVLPDRQNAFS
jgi:hypothetical protein